MGILNKLKFHAWNAVGTVANLVDQWEPGSLKTEKDYERSLAAYMREHLPDFKITQQYARDRTNADIVIEDKVIIELKNNMGQTAKYQRLSGQITQYRKWGMLLIIVLTGTTDKDLLQRIETDVENAGFDHDHARVIAKTS